MDIIILAVLLATAILMYRGAKRGLILSLWTVGFVLTAILFRIHVTSNLPLSF